MLNLLPWRQEKIHKDIKRYLSILLFLIIGTHMIALAMRHLFLDKCEELRRKKTEIGMSVARQIKIKEQLISKMLIYSRSQEWYRGRVMQMKLLSLLKEFPNFLPLNSYLTELASENNQVILQGRLLSSSVQGMQKFIDLICRQYGWSVKKFSISFLGVNDQKFYVAFAVGGK